MANIKKTNNLIIGNVTLDLVDDEARELIDTLRSDVESDIEDIRSDVSEDIADIRSDVESDISVIDARVDNLVTDVNGAETVTLWNGSMSTDGGTYTLSQSVANFDFIDIYYDNQYTGVADYLRIPASKTSAAVYIPMFETDSNNTLLEIGKVALTFSGTSVTVAAAKQYYWDGTSASNATVLNAQNSFPVRIDGVRSSASVNAELVDARLGANGIVYESTGSAVRKQINTVNSNVNIVSDASFTTENISLSNVSGSHYWNIETSKAVFTLLSESQWSAYQTPIQVEKGEIYSVKGIQGATHKTRIWVITDDDYNIISMADDYYSTNETENEDMFVVPENGKYLLITSRPYPPVISVKKYNPIKDDVLSLKEDVISWKKQNNFSITANYFWNIETNVAVYTPISGTYWMASTIIPIKAGEQYEVTGKQGPTHKARIWAVTDDNMNVLAMATDYYDDLNDSNHTEKFTVPEGGTKLVITTRKIGDVPYATLYKKETALSILNNSPLSGKTVAIIGDSISTNGNAGTDANVPELIVQSEDVGVELSAYLTAYDVQEGLSIGGHTFESSEIGTEVTFTPTAEDVGKSIGLPNNYNPNTTTVWWEVAKEELGFDAIPVCWSGSSITSHEASSSTRKTAHAWHPAQIRKCGKRVAGTMQRIAPDVIIIYRGTNDFSHEPYTLLTDHYFDNYNWQYPENDSVTGGYGFKEGLCLTIEKLREAYPNAQIWLCTLNVFKRINYSHFPTNNGINSLPQYNDAIREVADFIGCNVIEFDKDGITFENCYSEGYITDSATIPTHPTDKGHKVMGNKAIADIKAKYNSML